ncbi:MAG: hypothetical protein IKK21_00385 [Clostridia bacterium]|nr:hypothetical protein [Clostridia bacterium]
MMIDLFDRVKIKKNGVIGTVVDVAALESGKLYTVESDTEGKREDALFPSAWPLYHCKEEDIEKL